MGRDDTYRFELAAHPGRSKGAARYDGGLLAHSDKRPAHTGHSPERSPCPELRSLPPPALPGQRNSHPHRHTRYDALGRPTSATDNNDPNDGNDNSTVQWAYTREANGDLTVEETQGYGQAADEVVTTTYDLAGRLKSLEYPSGLTMSYSYDDLGRITAVNDGTNDRVADTYKGHLLEKRTYANGAYLTHLDDNSAFDTDGHG